MDVSGFLVANGVAVAKLGDYRDCGEGPWETRAEAVSFAQAEVGVAWRIDGSNGNWRVLVSQDV